jgi:hypothetical protein
MERLELSNSPLLSLDLYFFICYAPMVVKALKGSKNVKLMHLHSNFILNPSII